MDSGWLLLQVQIPLWTVCQVVSMGTQKSASSVLSPALCLKPLFHEHLSIITWTLCGKAGAGATRLSVFLDIILPNTSLLLQQMSYARFCGQPEDSLWPTWKLQVPVCSSNPLAVASSGCVFTKEDKVKKTKQYSSSIWSQCFLLLKDRTKKE